MHEGATRTPGPDVPSSGRRSRQLRGRRVGAAWVVGVTAVAAVTLWLTAGVFAAIESTSHIRGHALTAAVAGALASGSLLVPPPQRVARPEVVGLAMPVTLTILAAGQVLEAVGGFGWEADGIHVRSATLVGLHDVSLVLSTLAMVAVAGAFAGTLLALVLHRIRAGA